MKTSLEILADNPPNKFIARVVDFTAKIRTLEKQLGLPPAAPIWNARKANQRIAELEKMAATATAKPALSEPEQQLAAEIQRLTLERVNAPVASVAVKSPIVPAPEKLGAERFSASVKIAGKKSAPSDPNSRKTGRARFASAVQVEGQKTATS